MGNFFQELKRRNVYKVAAVYAGASWLLLQIADTLFPAFDMPDPAVKVLAVFLLFGFPIVLILSWAFELTAQGIEKTARADTEQVSPLKGKDYALVVLAVGLIIVVGIQQLVIFGSGADDESSDDAVTIAPTSEAPSDVATPGNAIPDKSVAVLPFVAMSSGADDGYFADGLTEELLNTLVQLSDLKVPGRTSSFYYKGRNEDLRDIGQALGVAHVLEGSVRRAGNQIRVTAQLVNTADGFHLWSDTFDRTLDDIFAIQDEIASEVTQALRVQLLGEEAIAIREHGTDNPEAQQLYIIAIAQLRELTVATEGMQINPEPYGRVRTLFERAVELDPEFAEAWAGLVTILLRLSRPGLTDSGNILLSNAEGTRLARDALARAESLARDAPATLLARAMVNERLSETLPTPENPNPDVPSDESILADYERALAAAPDNLQILREYSRVQLNRNYDLQASLVLLNRIIELDPLAPELLERAGIIGFFDPVEAERQLRVVADLYPDSPWRSRLSRIEMDKGHMHHAYLYFDEEDLSYSTFIPLSLGLDVDIPLANSLFLDRGGNMAALIRLVVLMTERDYEGALAYANSVLESEKDPRAGLVKALALYRLRRFQETAAFLRSEDMPEVYRTRLFLGGAMEFDLLSNPEWLDIAYALQQTGDEALAEAVRARIRENLMPLRVPQLAGVAAVSRLLHDYDFMLYASEGRVEEAMAEMAAMIEDGWLLIYGPSHALNSNARISASVYYFEDNPILDSVRDDPRFAALMDRVQATLAAQKAELDAGLTVDDIND